MAPAFRQGMEDRYLQRLARYQAAIALRVPDRVPISAGSNYFAEVFAGNTKQAFVYSSDQWLRSDELFVQQYPEVDNLRSGRLWGPEVDAVGWSMYKLPGRELSADVPFQFVERERMRSNEYDRLIENPGLFLFEQVLPRVFEELRQPGSMRGPLALLKGGLAAGAGAALRKRRAEHLEKDLGMPLAVAGAVTSPFDYLADGLRGLTGIMLDVFRRPDKVREACDCIAPHIVNVALSTADPLRRYPILMPLHRGCKPFLSPRQFDELYWPPLKKTMLALIEAGYAIRAYLEGDWGANWHHFRELPKGKLILDIDGPADIFRAKQEVGSCQCLAGGVPDSTLILGTPEDVRSRVRALCETVGREGGYIVNGGNGIPYDTRPQNFRALLEAVMEFGRYKDTIDFEPQLAGAPAEGWRPPPQGMLVPWQTKKQELGAIQGDEDLIRTGWEAIEAAAFNWMWLWLW